MAAQRRLQTEIDRCLKRVAEGLQEFQEIWDKVHDTDHSAQREKHEADLKKEIKKLQRLRDQIKTWISSAEVKDKTQLLDARRSIEREMERFKLCEKEAKMKAFSKAALGQADKLDPREQAKAEAREWINSAVDTLNEQIEKYEYEIEELAAGGGKKKSKPPARIEFLQSVITVHRKHTSKLEAALRALDNDALEPEGLDAVRDGLDYYLSQEDSEHYDNVDDLYADIADTLEAVETVAGPGTLVSHGSKGGSIGGGKEGRERSTSKGGGADDEKERERERERERAAAAAAKAQLVAQGAIVKSVDEDDGRPAPVRPGNRPPAVAPPGGGGGTPTPSPGVPASPGARGLAALQLPPAARTLSDGGGAGGLVRQDSGAGGLTSPQQGALSPQGAAAPSPAAESGNGSGSVMSPLAAAAAAAAGPGALRPGGPLSPQSAAAAAAVAGQGAPSGGRLGAWMAGAPAAAAGEAGKPGPAVKGQAAAGAAAAAPGQQQKSGKEEAAAAPAGGAPGPVGGSPEGQAVPAAAAPPAAAAAGEGGADAPAAAAPPAAPPPGAAGALASADTLADGVAGLSLDSSASGAAAYEVLSRLAGQDLGLGQLSAAPVGVGGSGAPASGGPLPALGVLDAAFRTALPQPVDSDWARSRPRHPVATPPSFPRSAPEIMSAPGLFRRMDPEALFFAFYYQPDTYQQYLAAQELKRQSWRYHKHHNAWFQRYAEPSVTNDEYEQGTYVYFDFHVVHDDLQSGWCYRRKENFVFRYDALEDDLPVAL